ncbi:MULTISPECIES: acylneuraminate cytidylyltransferase family protein [Vibrio]|uniref:acylneuraminate cytidylyltransferase family protein n=1 Tax=Vibrio TaxID=662 RepID=UPI0020757F1D|nr:MULTISPECIES: acylneuraminate cytidylyltransferase family protein [Vibrio]USD32712.1 acylneuraminate cytidylyltransferase family protein [Vibrio sp. SCSIO 43186]USD45752.1 acylneuraminate cytidylyltransferase family protein [Vibrio sp. SCSIO 43145]USD69837.1 acylneuraminate cytidylyltransferase family protein [Vibrio sp. SCSIO 43139]USD94744.1 CMP-N-acetlyneuraminic acid synthetase [Vibrio coralliilyticus]
MKILAIVPARGGSKRLPGKNIKCLHGKPLIQWAIESASDIEEISRVIVSTDSPEIAKIASQSGGEVPFMRPKELASDTSSSTDVVKHALKFYERQGEYFDYVLLLQPTSPIRNAEHVTEAIKLLQLKEADAVVSVCKSEHSPLWTNTLPDDLSMDQFITDDIKNTRSQDLPSFYRLNGAIYLSNVKRFYEESTMLLSSNIYAYKMDNECSVDIDHELDFLVAEAILKYKEKNV